MAARDTGHSPRRRHVRTASAFLTSDERSRAALNPPLYPAPSSTTGSGSLYNDAETSSPGASTSRTNSTATKIINTMRRQFMFVKRREADFFTRGRGMYSTPDERSSAVPSFLRYDDPNTRPTPEQIAMGLHLSRTPHLRPLSAAQSMPPPSHLHRSNTAYSQRRGRSPGVRHVSRSNRSASPIPLPPPPARSSLRNPGTRDTSNSTTPTNPTPHTSSTPSLSGSTETSTTPSTSRSSRAFFPLKLVGMSKFLTASRASSISDSSSGNLNFGAAVAADSSSATSDADSARPSRRKSVRFIDSFS